MNDLDPIDGQAAAFNAAQRHSGVTLHIERLVLDGLTYSVHERGQLQQALQQELTALIKSSGLGKITAGSMTPFLNAPAIRISGSSGATQVGTMVAGSVFNSLSQKF